MRMYEWIRDRIESTPGLTQVGLAERLGLNPSAINRMLHGNRNIMAWEVPVIEEYLGARFAPEIFAEDAKTRLEQKGGSFRAGFAETAPSLSALPGLPVVRAELVPVYGAASGVLTAGLNLDNSVATDWVLRHPAQRGIADAFAVYVFSSDMEPRYEPGELVYIHPGRPPEKGRDCLVEMKTGEAFLYRYEGQNEKTLQLAQLNPARDLRLPKAKIKGVYAVVGRG